MDTNRQKGLAVVVVLIMTIVFTTLGAGVLLYTRQNTVLTYHEIQRVKAYYVAESGLQYGIYQVNTGAVSTDGIYTWQIPLAGDDVPITYTITTNMGDGTKTVKSTVPNMSQIKLFKEP